MKRYLLAGLILLSLSGKALAWGEDGHKVVCRIAYDLLTQSARNRVDGLMASAPLIPKTHPQVAYTSFVDGCTYPDDIRPARRIEHFLNVARSKKTITTSDCLPGSQCILAAIASDVAILEHGADDAAKAKALLFVGHWLGDIHQPLHISYADDQGGNLIEATGNCKPSHTLHSVWDTCLVRYQGGFKGVHEDATPVELAQHRNAVLAYADALSGQITKPEIAKWTKATSLQWAKESFRLARTAGVQYCVMVGSTCQYSATLASLPEGGEQRSVKADLAYRKLYGPMAEQRLKMAGARLAAVIEAALK